MRKSYPLGASRASPAELGQQSCTESHLILEHLPQIGMRSGSAIGLPYEFSSQKSLPPAGPGSHWTCFLPGEITGNS